MFKFPDHVFVVAEGGLNHNGDLAIAKKLVDVAVEAGCDAVKWQVRTPQMCLKPELWNVMRDTPWGRMTYIEYRERIELSSAQHLELRNYSNAKKIIYFASPWDINSAYKVNYLSSIIKIPSAKVVDLVLVRVISEFGKPVIMSTGMCEYKDIAAAYQVLSKNVKEIALLACVSGYPVKVEDLNLRRITILQELFPECTIGYSGHETGLWTTLCAVAMGARVVERHITLDRTMAGSDHSASIEPQGLKKLVKEIRNFEKALGSGDLKILDCEQDTIRRLR